MPCNRFLPYPRSIWCRSHRCSSQPKRWHWHLENLQWERRPEMARNGQKLPEIARNARNGQNIVEHTHTHIYIYIILYIYILYIYIYIYHMKKYCVVTKCDKYLASNIFEAMFNMFQTQQDWNWVLQSTCMSWVLISAWVLTHRVKLFEHVPAPFPCQGQLLELSPVACLHRAAMSCN